MLTDAVDTFCAFEDETLFNKCWNYSGINIQGCEVIHKKLCDCPRKTDYKLLNIWSLKEHLTTHQKDKKLKILKVMHKLFVY